MSAARHFFALISQPNRFFCIKRPGGSAVFWSPRACVIIWKVMGRRPRPAPPGRSLAMVCSMACRGGPWPSRRSLRCGKPGGTMQASAPTGGVLTRKLRPPGWFLGLSLAVGVGFIPPVEPCGNAGLRLAAGFARHRRAGVHARRTAAIQNRDVRTAAGPAVNRAGTQK